MENVERLVKKFDRISNIDLTNAYKNSSLLVQGTAKLLVPVDTGQLRSSISIRVFKDAGEVFTNVEHGLYQEFGTVKMSPQSFMRPALSENTQKINEIFKKETKEQIKRGVGR